MSPTAAQQMARRTFTSRRRRGRLIQVLIGATLAAGLFATAPGQPAQAEAAAAPAITVKVSTYGSAARSEVLTAYYDKKRAGAPWIVDVHGGYWRGGSHKSDAAWARRMAASGYQVFVVDYPKETQAVWPAQRTSVTAAIRWIRARSMTYKIDSQRLALLGTSAGGQIAMNTAANLPKGRKAVATVSLAGINSPWDAYRAAHDEPLTGTGNLSTKLADSATILIGCSRYSHAACSARWEDAEATKTFGRDDGALAAWHCSDDRVVPVSHSQKAIARAMGNQVRDATLYEKGCDHHRIGDVAGVEVESMRWLGARLALGKTSAAWRAGR